MTDAYNVADNHPPIVKERNRLRDSWFDNDDYDEGVPGTVAAYAKRWVERVSQLNCLIAMPWSNAYPNSVARVNNKWLNVESTERGIETILAISAKVDR